MLVEGSELSIEIHKKHAQLWKKITRKPSSKKGPMRKANISFDDLRKHLSCRTGTNCEGIFTSIAPDLLRVFQQNLRWNLIIQSMNYGCGWSSRYAILFAAMFLSSNAIVESRHWSGYEESTDQGASGRTGRVTVCSALSCFWKWCWDIHQSREPQSARWLIVDYYSYMLSNSNLKQLNPVTHAVFSCTEVVYRVGSFSVCGVNDITDRFGSIWRLKRNRMRQWKTLQRAYKCSLVSSKGSKKSQSQINCTGLWKSFRISWKKWWSSFGDGWKAGCVNVHSSSSE